MDFFKHHWTICVPLSVCVHVVVFTLWLNGRCVLHTEILTSVCNNLCTHTRDSPACLCVCNFSLETCCRSKGKFCINTSQWSFKATQTLCWQSIKNVKLFSFYFSNMFKTSTGLHRLKINSVFTMNFLLEASFTKVIVFIDCKRSLINPVLLGLNH